MNETKLEMVAQLCATAGMMMEDASLIGVTANPKNSVGISDAVARLKAVSSDIAIIMSEEEVILRSAWAQP